MSIADYYSGLGIGSIGDNPNVAICRQVLKIDPETLRAIGEQYVCHRTPTPEGFIDVWDYQKLLSNLKFDEAGFAIVDEKCLQDLDKCLRGNGSHRHPDESL